MKNSLVAEILENKRSVREIIDEAAGDVETAIGASADVVDGEDQIGETEPDANYRHLFVRRWHEGDDKPYKRVKMLAALDAINLYFNWLEKYKQDKVEIWTDVATDAKNFYRFCLKNREALEPIWKQSARTRRAGKMWIGAYKDIQARARQNAANLVGTLFPFEQDKK